MQRTVLGLFYKDYVLLINERLHFQILYLVREVSSANQHCNGADLLRGEGSRLFGFSAVCMAP